MFIKTSEIEIEQKPVGEEAYKVKEICLKALNRETDIEWAKVTPCHSKFNSIMWTEHLDTLKHWFPEIPVKREKQSLIVRPSEPKNRNYYLNVFTLLRYCYELPFMYVMDTYKTLYGYDYDFNKLIALTDYHHSFRALNRGHSLVGNLYYTPELTSKEIYERLEEYKPHTLLFIKQQKTMSNKPTNVIQFIECYEQENKSIYPSKRGTETK